MKATDMSMFPPDVARLLRIGGITHVSLYAGRLSARGQRFRVRGQQTVRVLAKDPRP